MGDSMEKEKHFHNFHYTLLSRYGILHSIGFILITI